MDTLTIASWNINSVRLRLDLVRKFLRAHKPDILCLQETKCQNDQFPLKALKAAGYEHITVHGQKGYHGVATLSRHPFKETYTEQFCGKDDARVQRVRLDLGGAGPLEIHNYYVPAGGDIPDPEQNEKFAHKLEFLDEMARFYSGRDRGAPVVLLGDLNIAPLEHDVWSHKQLLKVVSHTPVEVERLRKVQDSLGWVDVTRAERPEPEKLYTWWSYRARDWAASDRGRRLDHIWVTPELAPRARNIRILRDARGWTKPSDHVPILVDIAASP